MKEICAQNKGYMHTCPDELAKLYEEKGKPIASRWEDPSTKFHSEDLSTKCKESSLQTFAYMRPFYVKQKTWLYFIQLRE